MNDFSSPRPVVTGLKGLQLGVKKLDASIDFYEHGFGLERLETTSQNKILFRANGENHHVLELTSTPHPRFIGIELAVGRKSDVDFFVSRLKISGFEVIEPAHELMGAFGGGYAATIKGVEGLEVRLIGGQARHADLFSDRSRPICLTHVVINSKEFEKQLEFFVKNLGFLISDVTERMTFLRCGSDHHTIALAHGDGMSLNHAAFEIYDFDSLMYASGRMIEAGRAIEWGPGRHGPGNNVFCYFIDPNGFAVEYTTGMEQVDESYPVGNAEYWTNYPRRPCRWGVAGKPSNRLAESFSGKGLDDE